MIEEKILLPILEYFINIPDIENHVKDSRIKERVATIRNMKIVIYSNDHEPPHFHVLSNDKSINAKFNLRNCSLISGEITSKDIKRIEAFHNDIKTQMVLEMIWNKKKRKL